MFAPRYLRHIVGNLQMLGEETNGDIRARANYVVMQVLFDRPDAKLHQVGVLRQVPARRRSAQARRAPLRLRQSLGRQRALPAGVTLRCFPGAAQHVAKRNVALQTRDRIKRPVYEDSGSAVLRAAPRPGNKLSVRSPAPLLPAPGPAATAKRRPMRQRSK
jgi:hypothetical protein